ncbi:DUF4267 domain-containing protein [Streptomyces inhibens]|uniref:DUF4267 domain-containing protein n=1 Tax=Streptomyces inhibens TaxID=2293571 RepID=UPI001EE71070|nr:DUF4267 domain-containing protein [Streptomyces inhibens]UKY50872.1 DUF4267 domain-containing protein [Streptomyces inhibens]
MSFTQSFSLSLKSVANALTVIASAGIAYVGVSYLIDPAGTAPGFGLPAWPHGDAAAFLNIKGVRDVVTGITCLALLLTGQRRALSTVMFAFTLIPLGDATVILGHDGSPAAAFGIHVATAVLVAATGFTLLRTSTPSGRTERTSIAGSIQAS